MSSKDILVPNIGDFKDVEVIEVLVKAGQKIKKNDSLITIESDKSSVEVPSTSDGVIEKIKIKIGDKVSEGDLILTVSEVSKTDVKEKPLQKNKVKEVVSKKPDPIPSPVIQSTSGVKLASPKVRKFARELGANVTQIQGSQRSGRVTEDDVKKFVKSQVSVNQGKVEPKKYKDEYSHEEFGEIEIKEIPRVKKLSGPQLVRSWTEIPHVTQHDEIDITEMEQFRTSLFDHFTGEKISVTPLAFITRAVVNALKDFPNFNCSIDPDQNKIVYKKYYHIGFAVDTPHGLMVPKLRDVDQMNIKEIGDELRKVSRECRDLKINKKEFFGGSMTISSLGGIGGTFLLQ